MALLFQNAKIQDLNVIHNPPAIINTDMGVVSECKDTRFECNSQHSGGSIKNKKVVSECKDTRFECNLLSY